MIKIYKITEAKEELIIDLYKSANWWTKADEDKNFIFTMLKQSFCVAGAFNEDKKLIGMGRIISDGIIDAYIQDVIVLTKYRKMGIGKKIVQFLVKYCQNNNISYISLVGEPGTEHFYKNLGFKTLVDYIPFIYKGE